MGRFSCGRLQAVAVKTTAQAAKRKPAKQAQALRSGVRNRYHKGMWPQQPETVELLDRARLGEPAAVNQLLARHRTALRRLVGLRLDAALSRRVDASDIVQDALLEASRRLKDYLHDPAMPFHLWLRQIALDRIIDAHRRHRQAQRRSLDRERPINAAAFADRSSIELAAQLVDPQVTPAAAAVRAELKRRFEAAVAGMNADDQEIILLRHFEQLSNQDAAEVLGLSGAAAGMRYLRAIRKLRKLLNDDSSAIMEPHND